MATRCGGGGLAFSRAGEARARRSRAPFAFRARCSSSVAGRARTTTRSCTAWWPAAPTARRRRPCTRPSACPAPSGRSAAKASARPAAPRQASRGGGPPYPPLRLCLSRGERGEGPRRVSLVSVWAGVCRTAFPGAPSAVRARMRSGFSWGLRGDAGSWRSALRGPLPRARRFRGVGARGPGPGSAGQRWEPECRGGFGCHCPFPRPCSEPARSLRASQGPALGLPASQPAGLV